VLALGAGLLGAGALATLTGCRVRLESDPLTTPPPPTADELARQRAAADADRLLELIDDVRRLRPDAATLLGQVATEHQAHLAALRLPPATTTPTPKPATTPSATPTPPLTKATALAVLARDEKQAADLARADLPDVSADLARLLAAIGASLDCHRDALIQVEPA
jgi:hypothetical protein